MNHTPSDIRLHAKSRVLEIVFNDERFMLPCEYLRVYSPSAEVQGHSADQEVLQTDKENVNIIGIEPVGNYAVRLVFSDEHDSGLFTWDYLYELGSQRSSKWQTYLDKLATAKHQRAPQESDHLLQ